MTDEKSMVASKSDILDIIAHIQKMQTVLLDLSIISLKHTTAPREEVDRLMKSMGAMAESFDEIFSNLKKSYPGLDEDE